MTQFALPLPDIQRAAVVQILRHLDPIHSFKTIFWINMLDYLMLSVDVLARGTVVIIRTQFVHPPISLRDFDWVAVNEETRGYSNATIGYGSTEQEAIVDLVEQLKERGEVDCASSTDI